jgi:hypothetical protein
MNATSLLKSTSALTVTLGILATHVHAQCDAELWPFQLLAGSGQAAGDHFGASVAASGNVAVVGAPGNSVADVKGGSVYVFYKFTDTWWGEYAKFTANDAIAGARYGTSVAIDGNTAIVGAPYDVADGSDSGAAYIVRDLPGWQQIAKLTPADGAAGYEFGCSVSISGNTAVIGAQYAAGLGFAYIFREIGGVWQQIAKLTPADAAPSDWFGTSVAISGDTLLVGSPRDDDHGAQSGSVYVFREIFPGTWHEIAKLTAVDGSAADLFGISVAFDGGTAVVGSWMDDDAGSSSGSAYVFREVEGAWAQIAKLTASDAAASDYFGRSVSISGNAIVIGAPFDDDHGANSGSAYAYREVTGTWRQVAKISNGEYGEAGENFGYSVAASGNIAVIGAYQNDLFGNDGGAVFLVDLSWVEPVDCNINGVPDMCDIAGGTSADCNANGIPDECESFPGDLDGDGTLTAVDVQLFVACCAGPAAPNPGCDASAFALADFDGDGDVDLVDFAAFQVVFPMTCP